MLFCVCSLLSLLFRLLFCLWPLCFCLCSLVCCFVSVLCLSLLSGFMYLCIYVSVAFHAYLSCCAPRLSLTCGRFDLYVPVRPFPIILFHIFFVCGSLGSQVGARRFGPMSGPLLPSSPCPAHVSSLWEPVRTSNAATRPPGNINNAPAVVRAGSASGNMQTYEKQNDVWHSLLMLYLLLFVSFL